MSDALVSIALDCMHLSWFILISFLTVSISLDLFLFLSFIFQLWMSIDLTDYTTFLITFNQKNSTKSIWMLSILLLISCILYVVDLNLNSYYSERYKLYCDMLTHICTHSYTYTLPYTLVEISPSTFVCLLGFIASCIIKLWFQHEPLSLLRSFRAMTGWVGPWSFINLMPVQATHRVAI